ncbi:MAG: glycosyltransferase family 4 protein [Chloroflexota bacterium]
MKLLYIMDIRLPTEKAHGLQVIQNCEAFADAGVDVTLWVARRVNTAALRAVRDVWSHYGVKQNFVLRRLPSLDLLPLVAGRSDALARMVFALQLLTFLMGMFVRALFTPADVYYSRDERVIVLLSLIKPLHSIAYESHNLSTGRIGRVIQRQAARRAGSIFAVTSRLRDDLIALGANPERAFVARDGIRAERFAKVPDQAEARRQLGWAQDGFIVGYVGRLQTLAMDKGVGALVEALAKVENSALALVGGPDEMAETLRQRWLALGQDESRFLYSGQVAAERVPVYLSGFDACALPSPWTPFFAYYTSPMKLFEYMASHRPILASDLPSNAEVVTDGESALLVPPGDVDAIAAAVRRLKDDAALRQRLADNAYALVMEQYTWHSRAQAILSVLKVAP